MRRLPSLLLVLALAGCALPGQESRAPAAPPPSVAERLVVILERLRPLDEKALAIQADRARRTLQLAPADDFARIEAALALALAPSADDAEVLALVAPLLHEGAPTEPALRTLAGFLQVQSVERQKLRESLAAAQAKARDEHREVLAQRGRADAQQDRADKLQQKLDALTNLEKSLARRRPEPKSR